MADEGTVPGDRKGRTEHRMDTRGGRERKIRECGFRVRLEPNGERQGYYIGVKV